MNVDGSKVEVKSVVQTEYKGSDGYPIKGFVFSNMKTNPNADRYILRCLSPDRSKVLKKYEIPANQVKQRTLTITDNSKYEKFRKQASQTQPIGLDGRSPHRKKRLKDSVRSAKFQAIGMAVGATLGYGPIRAAKDIAGMTSKTENANFGNLLGMAIGTAIGKNVGKAMAESKRRQHE